MRIAVCVKHAPRRVRVDPLTAEVAVDPHDVGLSAADEAALELGLRFGAEVTVVTAGPPDAERSLRDAAAVGADRLVRCDAPAGAPSDEVAAALAGVCRGADLVLCGDYSADRGSGSVPAFLAARLGAAQALGVVDLTVDGADVVAERRLDRGRRERVRVPAPGLVSVEGAVARLRRAPLDGVLAAAEAEIEAGPPVRAGVPVDAGLRPHRPRVQARPGPDPRDPPLQRMREVVDLGSSRTPPRVVHAEPEEAAAIIVDALVDWGYLER